MENFKVEIAKIVGVPTPTSWAQTLVQDNLYLVSEISAGEEEVAALGKELLVNIGQKFQNQNQQNLASLKQLVTEALEPLPPTCEVNLTLVKVAGDVAYLVIKGGGKVFLKRKGLLESVLTSRKEEISGGSGFLKEEDLLILATSKFAKLVSKEELADNLDGFTSSEVAERLSPKIHQSEEGSGVACIILSFTPPSLPKFPRLNLEILKKNSFLMAILLLLILLLSIVFGIRQRTTHQRSEEFKGKMSSAAAKYEEGRQLLELNRNLAYQALLSAKKILEEERSKIGKTGKEEKEIISQLVKINELLLRAGRIYKIDSPQVFFDLTLIKEGGMGTRFALWGEQLTILDGQNKNLYSLSVVNKSSKIVAANLKSPELMTADLDNFYVLGEEGIYKIQKKDNKIILVVKEDDPSSGFGEIAGLSTFLSNIYLLDKKNSVIHKYIPSGETYLKKSYLAPDIKPDFSKAVSWAIDGEVYVLLEDGTILKYFQGAPKSFKVSGLDVPFSNPKVIFTAADSKNVYILDSGNKRVVVLDKEGNYQAQYQWPASPQGGEGIKDVQDLVVSESQKKLLLLSGNKIYTIELKD